MTDLPTGWTQATLEDLVTEPAAITDGPFGSNLKTSHYTNSGPRVIRLQNVGDGVFIDEHAHISEDHYRSLERHRVEAGDVVVASLGDELPRACVIPLHVAPAIVKADCIRVRLHADIDARYVSFALNSPQVRRVAADLVHGVGRPRLGLRVIRSLLLPLAPSQEQRRIVAAIEEHFSRLDAADLSLTRARWRLEKLRAGLLAAALDGWPENQLGEISKVYVGTTPSRGAPELWGGGVPWVSSGEVAFCRIRQTRETISPDAVTSPDRLHPPGTVLLAMIGEGKTRGQAAILDVAATHNQNSAAVRLDRNLCAPEWLFHVLMARYEETRRAGSGAQQPALNRARVEALKIPLPPLEEQHRIVAEVEQRLSVIDAMLDAIETAKARSTTLRRSILERAFRGELVPQDPSDEPASVLLQRIAAERAAAGPPRRRPSRPRATMKAR